MNLDGVAGSPAAPSLLGAISMRRALLALVLIAGLPVLGTGSRMATDPGETMELRPFAPGERLDYVVRTSRFGEIGSAVMRVRDAEPVRGEAAWLLSFELDARVLLFGVESRTRSWVQPEDLASLRYVDRQRAPGQSRDDSVEILPELGRWQAQDGASGPLASERALDELSFLYFARTIPLARGTSLRIERHFDAARNPVRFEVVDHQSLRVPAGEFDVARVRMTVRDPRHFDREQTVTLWITDDVRRLPVRIESSAPFAGRMILELSDVSR